MDAYWSRLVPPTGTKGSPTWAPRTGHVEAHLSRFWIEPGLKGQGISTDPLVPVQEPGQKALTNRDNMPFFYQCRHLLSKTLEKLTVIMESERRSG